MLVPRNITVTTADDRYVQVSFALSGYMECYQAYRREGLYTDVSINCLHPNSGDETIYLAHNVLLSSASPYFSFILMKAFNQLTNMRTNSLKNTLRVIETDNSFQDQSLISEENFLSLKFQTFYKITNNLNEVPSYCSCASSSSSLPSSSGVSESSVHSRNNPNFDCEKCHTNSETWTLTMRSFVSLNNIVLVVKGIEPLLMKYVLYCVYSESFLIDKRNINIFLGLIMEMKLTNHSTLNELLKPYIESQVPHIAVHRRGFYSENLADNQSDYNSTLNDRRMQDFTVYNSLYDTQLEHTLKLRSESSATTTTTATTSQLGETLVNPAQTDFHVYEIPTKNANDALSGDTFVSDACKNNSTNVVYNSTFDSSSCYPYSSSENNTNSSIATIPEETGLSILSTSQAANDSRMYFEEYKNDLDNARQFSSIKRKVDMISEDGSSTSAFRTKNNCLTPSRQLSELMTSAKQPSTSVLETSQGKALVVNLKNDYEVGSYVVKKAKFDELIKNKDTVLSDNCKNSNGTTCPLSYEVTDMVLKKLEKYPSLQVTRLEIHNPNLNTIKTTDDMQRDHNANIVVAEIKGQEFQGMHNYAKEQNSFELRNCIKDKKLFGSRNDIKEREVSEQVCNKRQELFEAKDSTEMLELPKPNITKKPKLFEPKNSVKKLELSEHLNFNKKTEIFKQKDFKKPQVSKYKNCVEPKVHQSNNNSLKKPELFELKSSRKKPDVPESKNSMNYSELSESRNSIKKTEIFELQNSIKKPKVFDSKNSIMKPKVFDFKNSIMKPKSESKYSNRKQELFEPQNSVKKPELTKPKVFIKKSELSEPKKKTELIKPRNYFKKLKFSDPSFAEIFPDLRRIRKQVSTAEEDNNKSLENLTICNKVPNRSSEIQCISPEADVDTRDVHITEAVSSNSKEDQMDYIKCFGCDFTSTVFNDFITHIKLSHRNEKVKIVHCIDLNCCVQLLLCSKEWKIHIQRHLEKFFYNCSFCSYSTTTKTGVTRHERTHKKWTKRVTKPHCTLNATKKSQPIHVGCVTRSARRVREKPTRTMLYKQEKKFGNQIKVKNVFATSTFRKLKRSIRMKQNLYSVNVHSRFLRLLDKLPILTLSAGKSFKSTEERTIPSQSDENDDKKYFGDRLDKNSTQIIKNLNDVNSLLEKEKDSNKKRESNAGEKPVQLGESKEKITVEECKVQKIITDICSHKDSNSKDSTTADRNLAFDQADSESGMVIRPTEQDKYDRNIPLKRKEKKLNKICVEKNPKINNNIGKETVAKVVNSHLEIKEREKISFVKEKSSKEGNIYKFGKVLVKETRLKMDRDLTFQRKESNNSNISGKLYKFKDSSYRKKVNNGTKTCYSKNDLDKKINSVQRERCPLAIEDLNLIRKYSLKSGDVDLAKIKDKFNEKKLKGKYSNGSEGDVSDTEEPSNRRGRDEAMHRNQKDMTGDSSHREDMTDNKMVKDRTKGMNCREKYFYKNELNDKIYDAQSNENSNLQGKDFTEIDTSSLRRNDSVHQHWNLREVSDLADSNDKECLKDESLNPRENYSSENWKFREEFYSGKSLKSNKYTGHSETLGLGNKDQSKIQVISLRETELAREASKNLTNKNTENNSGILTYSSPNLKNKELCLKEKKKKIICNFCDMKLSSQKGLERHYNLYHYPCDIPGSCTHRKREDQMLRTSCPDCSNEGKIGGAC